MPLTFLCVVGMIKEGVADWKRFKQDKKMNAAPVVRIDAESSKACFNTVRTDELKVGDIIEVKDDEVVPADCFLLGSKRKTAFISTGSLDGERNLKPKMPIRQIFDQLEEILAGNSESTLEVSTVSGPTKDLFSF